MKLSTRFYRMRHRNKKGFLLFGIPFLFLVLIIVGGTMYFLSPSGSVKKTSVSNFRQVNSKSSGRATTKHTTKVTTKSTTTITTKDSSNSSGLSSSNNNDTSTTAAISSTTTSSSIESTKIYTATDHGYSASSSLSFEDAQANATLRYKEALEQEENTANSVAKEYEESGYNTHIYHVGGGN
jgi:hypothetical protein